MASLKEDRLPSLDAIAEFTGDPVRRLRTLITHHGFPARKRGGKWEGFKSEIEPWYRASNDAANGAS